MARTLITHPVILELLEEYKPLWSLNHLSALAHWDLNTYMPHEGSEARGEALSQAATLYQKLFLDPHFVALLDKASLEKNLGDYERGILRLFNRSLHFYRALPPVFLATFVKVTSDAHLAWKEAKESNTFGIFAPFLEKIVHLSREKAKYLGYHEHPYDALLDEYEEGLTTQEVEAYFAQIKKPLQELLKNILNSPHYRSKHVLEEQQYAYADMHACMQQLLTMIHYGQNHLRLDTSPHPFSTSLGKGDARITTRYSGKDISYPYTSTMHEYGHALYEIQSHDDLHYTPISGGSSLVIHESQSRFWENCIGRSKVFLERIVPLLVQHHSSLAAFTLDEVYHFLNLVKLSLIRTEADEITYHFHIMIRFEIEKALIEGSIAVKDIPTIWKALYKEYLGVEPSRDAEGVLQDIHWSQGSIGYFPTYSLGTALSIQWKEALEKDIGQLSTLVNNQEGIRKIQEWLKKHIHQHGSAYTFRELVQRVTGKPFSAQPLLTYLTKKYELLYP